MLKRKKKKKGGGSGSDLPIFEECFVNSSLIWVHVPLHQNGALSCDATPALLLIIATGFFSVHMKGSKTHEF